MENQETIGANDLNKPVSVNQEQVLQTMSTMVSRMALSGSLGQTYGGARDLYQALGYPTEIRYDDYVARYFRQDIARAIIDRPVKATWQGKLELVESDKESTPFEEAWDDLNDQFGLQSIFSRLDRLTSLGKYGILLLGLDDVRNNEDFRKPAQGRRKLVYLMPFGEGSALINTYENNPTNARYGKPLTYSITVQQTEGGNSSIIEVHHSRIVHVVNNPLESEVESAPVLEAVYNRLIDLEKLVGGDAEMFWRGARPGYSGSVDKEFQVTPQTKQDLKDQIDEYEHNLRRILVNEGIDLKALDQQISDPLNHVDIQIQMISADTGIPKRILTGSERGELSSAQDSSEWKTYVRIRRQEHAEPQIIRKFVSTCISFSILPKPSTNKYSISWEDLFALSEADRVKIGQGRAEALKNYTASPMAEIIFPPEAFVEFCMGLTSDQINVVRQSAGSSAALEQAMIDQTQQQQQQQQQNPTNKVQRTK
jgi:uncharacterized protein